MTRAKKASACIVGSPALEACVAALVTASALAAADSTPLPRGVAGGKTDLVAEIGYSTKREPLAAAEQATRSMLSKLKAGRRRPAVVLFLERTGRAKAADGPRVGDRVKQLAAAPTYGSGGPTGTWGPTWWAKQDREAGFQVLGLAGEVTARAHVAGGALPAEPGGLRDRAEVLGRQVDPSGGGRLGLLFCGAGSGAGEYLSALRRSVVTDVPLIGAVGEPGDYVYADGRPLTDPAGKPAAAGQLLLMLEAPVKVAFAGIVSRNEADAPSVLAEADLASGHAMKQLAGRPPDVVFAFSSVGRFRTCSLNDPRKELARLQAAFGRVVPVFGGFCRFQMGVDSAGRFSVGRERLMLVAISGGKAKEKAR